MRELYELKDKLCDELKRYSNMELSAGSLDIIDKLTHSIKNLDKVIDVEGYSNRESMGRDNMGRYSRGYSRHDGYGGYHELR